MPWRDEVNDRSLPQSLLNFGVDSLPDAVLVADAGTGRIVEANAAAGELFNCRESALIGRHQLDLHPGDPDEDYAEAFERATEGNRVNRLTNGQPLYIETHDGRRVPVEINIQRVETDDGVFILGVFRETTEQLHRERRLEATTSRLETLLDALPVPATVLDTDGTIQRWNRAAETTFGYDSDAVVGQRYPLFVEDEEFERVFERVLEDGILDGYETHHRARDGSRIPVELSARAVSQNDRFSGIVGTAIDLSDRQQREQQLDVLHRVLRHDLRNKLAIIRGWTRRLSPADPEESAAVDEIEAASDHLLGLSEQAKRIRTGLLEDTHEPGSIPITNVISLLTDQVAERDGATMRVAEAPASGSICRRGQRAVSELLANVLNQVDEAGLELAVETHDRHVVLQLTAPVPVLPAGARAFIETGEETALEHGSDLGVAKAYLMAESIGGNVAIESEAEGTLASTLVVELPRMDGLSRE
jgi:PAS domain S-box-containing protein